MKRIYFDNNATTPLDPRVLEAMMADLSGPPANPSSVHSFGRDAKKKMGRARETIAAYFQVTPEEVIFTSGGTESINLMLRGLPQGHIITTSIEHSSVFHTLQSLEKEGFSVTYLAPGLFGAPTPEQVEAALRPDTRAIVLSASNGETGVRIDLGAFGSLAERRSIPLLIDGVAYLGKEPLCMYRGVAGWALSGHKFHAPKGVGALIVRSNTPFHPLLTGGPQERGRRGGTENLSGILGLAEAIRLLSEEEKEYSKSIFQLRSRFETELLRALPNITIHGLGPRISNTSNVCFVGCDGETLLLQLDQMGIAASHGSACSSGALEPSRILLGMGVDRKSARSSIRFSFSRMNTEEEIDRALEQMVPLVRGHIYR
jgi:cysteine desulfurase